jgi:predicted transcriptional regulator YdeE
MKYKSFLKTNMNRTTIKEFQVIGIALETKTTNENGQSGIDCGSLWQKFENENCLERIPGKLTNEIFAVYHSYEGDYTKPFSYFIGCKVPKGTHVPEDFGSLLIPGGTYEKIFAKGRMPDCVADGWKAIWNSQLDRLYKVDFEVYDEKSKDWNNAQVNLFISVK